MIKCHNSCPLAKSNGCCWDCPELTTCPESCEEKPALCGDAVFDEETGLQVFKDTQLTTLDAIANLTKQKKVLEEQEKAMKAALLAAMEKFGVKKFESDILNLTYVAPTKSTGIDSAKLKKKYPDVFADCSKTTDKAGYVKITLKGGEQDGNT